MRLNKIALTMTVFTLTALMLPLAFAQTYTLNVYSLGLGFGPGADPLPGVPFTLDGGDQVTPFSAPLDEGPHTVVMPSTAIIDGTTYNFGWWDTGSTDPTRTIDLTRDTSIYAHYEVAPPHEAGNSPGYWKHQFRAYIDGKGKPQETWDDLVMWTGEIDAAAKTPPTPWDLPPIGSIDYDGDGTFTTDDAYNIFTDKTWKELWIPVANWYNWAAGLEPYPD